MLEYITLLNRTKIYTICLVTVVVAVVLSVVVFRSTNIHRYLKICLERWIFRKRHISVATSCTETDLAVNLIKRSLKRKNILGLDCEWVSVGKTRHPVALLQLSGPDGYCALFRLSSILTIPPTLKVLLEDKEIVKVGVAVANDARYLLADYGVCCESFLDLRYLAAEAGVSARGLASLAKDLFNIQLDKDWRVRCSNWEAETLTSDQIRYAVEDARIAVQIFDSLNKKMVCKHYSIWKRLFWREIDYWNHGYKLWSCFLGLNYHVKSEARFESQGNTQLCRPKSVMKVPRRSINTLLQKPHYSNIYLLAPDDQVLCTISESKAAWYKDKELVDIVCEDPKTLRLKFEPSNRSSEDGYYTKPKDNKCVVCGSETDLRRKNVVPVEYRRHFDVSLKNHHSHDVLLLCLHCHLRSNLHDQMFRDTLAVECDAPITTSKVKQDADLKALKSAARALLYNIDKIPDVRKKYLQSVIMDQLSLDVFSNEVLKDLVDIDYHVESENYLPHGLKVVQHFSAVNQTHQKGVEELERRWRQFFLNTMQPQHLPQLWSVHYVRD